MATHLQKDAKNSNYWIFQLLLHGAITYICVYFHFFRCDVQQIMIDEGVVIENFGGSTKFLTVWGQYLTLFYVGISFVNDALNVMNLKSNKLNYFLNGIFYPVCTTSTIIGILFWSIFLYDTKLLMPDEKKDLYPMTLNVFQHGCNGIILWIDLFICGKQVIKKSMHHITLLLLNGIYQAWLLICAYFNGEFAYPFMNDLTVLQHIIFFVAVVFIGVCIQSFIIKVILVIHQKEQTHVKKID